MWKLGFRFGFVVVLLVFYCQVTGEAVQAKRWFQPDERHGVVEQVCRNGIVVSGISDFAKITDEDRIPTVEQIGKPTTSLTVQFALYTDTTLPSLPAESDDTASDRNDTPASAYGSVLAEGILTLVYQTTPFSYTTVINGVPFTDGRFYDYTSLTLPWSPELAPGTRVVVDGISDGLFYMPVQDCYINTVGYQGYLANANGPANGIYDFQFGIYDESVAGYLVGDLINRAGITVTAGVVNVELPVSTISFTGPPRWLEVRVKETNTITYTTLSPRQPLLATPYALDAQNAHYAATSGYSYATRGLFVDRTGTVSLSGNLDLQGTQIYTDSGVYVRFTSADASGPNGDGLRVCATGDRSCEDLLSDGYDPGKNGLEVGNAQDDGVHIIAAGDDGVQIGDETLSKYPAYGLYIPDPGVPNTALLINTADVNDQWALSTPDKIYAGGGYFTALSLIAQVAEGESLTPGDLVAAAGLGTSVLNANNLVPQVRLASEQGLNGIIGVVEGRMTLQPAPGKAEALVLHSAEGPAQAGDYVALTVYGVAQVKAQAVTDVIAPGQRLTAAQQLGTARVLRTETLNGMVVSEGAPVVGIALAPVDPVTGLLPVFVTLR